MMGDSVVMHNNVIKKPGDEKIVWRIQHNNSPVAEIIRNGKEADYKIHDERFRDRLQVDQTGDLIITNIRPDDAGSYEVDITVGSHTHTIHRSFNVNVKGDQSSGAAAGISVISLLVAAAAAAVAAVIYYRQTKLFVITRFVFEGESVDLKTEVTDIQRDDVIEWRFGETLIAKINPANNIFSTYDGDYDLFRGKLNLNDQTGDLNINGTTLKHDGGYYLKIIRDGKTSFKGFYVCLRGK
ncbi:uncharacterized protein [Misgurnus anguillicaudatus]|uniref:uncharacterized protein n=1 Tax=Misgurnus anguillicaudatus TaxID=75329 RepID=UPI003CCFCB06